MTDLERLAEEVQRTQEPCVLRRNGVDIAVLTPVNGTPGGKGKKSRAEAIEAFRKAAGSWRDVDVDKLLEDIYESRRRPSTRPPVEL